MLIEIIRQRLLEIRRKLLVAEVAEAHQAYQSGDIRRGSTLDVMKELDD